MPNFHTHWLVAVRAIEHAPPDVKAGWIAYRNASLAFGAAVRHDFETLDSVWNADAFQLRVEGYFKDWQRQIGVRRNNHSPSITDRVFHNAKDSPTFAVCRDNVTCFSAYMLGACGPDFWTFPSWGFKIPDVAAEQFNLGHYNRSHRQFQASVQAIGNDTSLQSRVQRAYFSGMAAHIAADLIIHELVNISAGAYALLHELWFHENLTDVQSVMKKWTLHNKVEHYWDTYVRYAKFGDIPDPFLGPGAKQEHSAAGVGGFLTLDSLIESRPEFEAYLPTAVFRWMLERPITFPHVFCDRVLARDGIAPFIYDVVINRAHPKEEVHPVIGKERTSRQMKDRGLNEGRKLGFFSTDTNEWNKQPYSWNYLLYDVCPNLKQVRKFGRDVFYHLSALDTFVEAAVSLATVFLGDLTRAYVDGKCASIDDVQLPNLGRFWNLDTGLGLEVKNVTRRTQKEVVTVLDFVHATSVPGVSLRYVRPGRNSNYLGLHKLGGAFGAREKLAFPVRRNEHFEGWGDVSEVDENTYLPRLDVGKVPTLPPLRPVEVSGDGGGNDKPHTLDDCLFDGTPAAGSQPAPAPTQKLASDPKVEIAALPHRLTLALKVPIPAFGADPEEIGLFIYGDGGKVEVEAKNSGFPTYMGEAKNEEWLTGRQKGPNASVIEFQSGIRDPSSDGSLHTFTSNLLLNLDPSPPKERKLKLGQWNNVIPYQPELKRHGRNFAIATGRNHVLHPTDSSWSSFNPLPDEKHDPFLVYAGVSPTEHVCFSVHVLTKGLDGKVRDAMTREVVTRDKLAEIRRIDAAGFVKLVLYYVIRPDGAFQLDTCHIDGVPVRIKTEG